MKKKNVVSKLVAFIAIISTASIANATNLNQIVLGSASAKWMAGSTGYTSTLTVNFVVNNTGTHHTCSVRWINGSGATSYTASARLVSVSGSSENWQAVQTVTGQLTGTVDYAATCTDLSGQQQIVTLQYGAITTNGVTLQSPVGSTTFGFY